MQFGRIDLVVVHLRIGRMIAAAVDEDTIDLRELCLLSVPRSQVPQRAVDEYHGGSPAVADEAVGEPRTVERRCVERTIERAQRSCRRCRGPRFLLWRVCAWGWEE